MVIKLNPKWIIYFEIVFSVLYKSLGIFGMDVNFLNYITHFFAIILLYFVLSNRYGSARFVRYIKLEMYIILFLLCITFLGIFLTPTFYRDILNYFSAASYIKGILNFFRFFILYLACVKFFSLDDIRKMYKVLWLLFLLNVFLCLIECFALGYKWDYLGGTFGVEMGGNAGLNVILVVAVSMIIIFYLNKKINMFTMVIIETVCTLIASIAELKIFYFEIVLIIALCIMLERRNYNTIKVIVVSVAILLIGLLVLGMLFPEQLALFLNPEDFVSYATESYEEGTLGRLTMFSQLEDILFCRYPIARICGFGIGMFDPTSGSYLAKQYSSLRVGWFTNSCVVLNLGYLGLGVFFLFMINAIIKALKERKKCDCEERLYINHSIVITVIMIVSMWYNSSMISGTTAYLIFYFMAIPTIILKNRENQRR